MKKVAFASCAVYSCSGFLLQKPFSSQGRIQQEGFRLAAKASKKRKQSKRTRAPSGGGFGSKKVPAEVVNDFAVFPALEKPVADTLLPTPPGQTGIAGDLPLEVYDRLDQIYGFPNFNYESSEARDPLSFDELISLGGSSSDLLQGTSGPEMEDSPLDLLSYNTGEGNKSTPNVSTIAKDGTIAEISKLSPFSQLRVLHLDPLVIAVDDFFAPEECDRFISMSLSPSKSKKDDPYQTRSMTVGKDAEAKSQRTSTTWFHHYKNLPELMAKASRLFGLDRIDHFEEPQTVRYRKNEKFTWHLDALSPEESTSTLGGQRIATLLVYLTDLRPDEGGATIFRDLSDANGTLKVRPKKGSALIFFPAAGGIPNAPLDIRTLHCGEVVDEGCENDKWISQLWLRQAHYNPSAPVGNTHAAARDAIVGYCEEKQM